jgi:long-chain acyl-CoA synthetase
MPVDKSYIGRTGDPVVMHVERGKIREFAKARLAAYKVPRAVEFRDELPKTMIGKVLRRALVEQEQARAEARTAEAAHD